MNDETITSRWVKAQTATQKKEIKVSSVNALALSDKALLHKVFLSYHNNFELSEEIKAYCTKHSLDKSYLGIAKGSLYKGISKRQPSYVQLQNLGLLNKEGKDCYGNHLVIPTLEGMQVTSLEFIDINELTLSEENNESPINILPLSDNAFRVDLNGRLYMIQGLVKSEHQLKATVKLHSGRFKHVDVINFYSAGNRKRLIRDICELFQFPYEDIRADITKLMDLCETYQTKKNPHLSIHANELLITLNQSTLGEFTSNDIEELMLWNRMKVHRVIKELCTLQQLEKVSNQKPYTYKTSVISLQNSVDLQCFNKIT